MLFGLVISFSAVQKICCLQLNSLLILYEITMRNIIQCTVEIETLIIILFSWYANEWLTELGNRWESDNSTNIIGCRSCLEAFSRVLFNRGDRGMMRVDIGLYFRLIKSKCTVPNLYILCFFGVRKRIPGIGIAGRLIWEAVVQRAYNYCGFWLVLGLLSITVFGSESTDLICIWIPDIVGYCCVNIHKTIWKRSRMNFR